jgi:hypothetical protein
MKTHSYLFEGAGAGFKTNVLTAFALWACLANGSLLQAGSPDFTYFEPRGGQRGTEVEIKLIGNRLADAEEVVFYESGLTGKDLKYDDKSGGRVVNAKVVIAPDARLGLHIARVRTKSGLSYARTFWVSQFSNVLKANDNNLLETAQPVPLNVTVDGTTKPESSEYFVVEAKKGQRLSVEVEGVRANSVRGVLGIDPYVGIMNMKRFLLASADDTPLLKQDCFVSCVIPEDGKYIVEVRDSAYQGNARFRAHIGTYPRPTVAYPAGGQAGTEVEFTMIGDPKGDYRFKTKLPAEPKDRFELFAPSEGFTPPSANVVRVSGYPNVLEEESKNNEIKTLDKSSGLMPLAFNGILQAAGDVDHFRFTAKKGQRFLLRVHAKRINSPVDPILQVMNDKGSVLGGNDDADNLADSKYDFSAPADGDYFVRVTDHLKRGGADFVYRVESEVTVPSLIVSKPEFEQQNDQARKTMDIPRGGRYATLVNVTRQNFRGDVKFEVEGLPSGVTMSADVVPAAVTQFPVVFEASKDAPLSTKLTGFYAVSTDPATPLRGRYVQGIQFVRSNPNNTPYFTVDADVLPVTVAEEAPFTVELKPLSQPLVRDGQSEMKVVATRKEGFTKPITLRWMWRPPGISCNATATIPEGQNETTFSLTASGAAELRNWKVCVLAESDAGQGLFYTASGLVDMPVEDQLLKMTMNLGTVVQGGSGEILVDVEAIRDFQGEAVVSVVGLPPKTKIGEVKIKPGMEQIKIPVQAEETAPVGQHKNLFCDMTLTVGGKPVIQRAGMGGLLRIDPKPKETPKPAAVVVKNDAPKKPAAEKPLSRLEQLRLEAQKEAAAK